jgi:RNA 2',3'-cyclic 3'-phosphodiesterase
MANWFIGIGVPSEGWFAKIAPPPEGFRMFAPEDLHLTIAFLGSVSEAAARDAWQALDLQLASTIVSFGRVEAMGHPRRYSALSLSLADGRESIERAIGEARDGALAAAGAAPDLRPPKAHVTIARPRRRYATRRAAEWARAEGLLWANAIDVTSHRVQLERVALYTWSPDRNERLFRIVSEAKLQPRSA